MTEKLSLTVTRENIESVLQTLPDDIAHWEGVLADALYKQYITEQKVAYVRAKVNITVRQTPLDFGISKITEDSVKVVVEIQEEVRAAEAEYASARLEVSNAKAICSALDAKRSACKYLSELWLSGKLG